MFKTVSHFSSHKPSLWAKEESTVQFFLKKKKKNGVKTLTEGAAASRDHGCDLAQYSSLFPPLTGCVSLEHVSVLTVLGFTVQDNMPFNVGIIFL